MAGHDTPAFYEAVTSETPTNVPSTNIATPLADAQVEQRTPSENTLPAENGKNLDDKAEAPSSNEDTDQQNAASSKEEEEQQEGPPLPVGFLDKSLAPVRKEVLLQWIKTGNSGTKTWACLADLK